MTEKQPAAKRTGKMPSGQLGVSRQHPRKGKHPGRVAPKNQCGARKTGNSSAGPGFCTQAAGYRTDHPGYGNCAMHSGNTRAGRTHAARLMAQALLDGQPTFGAPIEDKDPGTILLEEVGRTAGHVAWLGERIQMFGLDLSDAGALLQLSEQGYEKAAWVNLYQSERQHLIRACKAALDAGVAERKVRLAEEQGALLATVIRSILFDPELALTGVQREIAPTVVRRHLTLLPTGTEE